MTEIKLGRVPHSALAIPHLNGSFPVFSLGWTIGAKRGDDNSPAIYGWENRQSNVKVPRGTAEWFFRPRRDLGYFRATNPSLERLGYCQRICRPTGLGSSPSGWDLSRLGSGERNLPKAKARRAERAGASESLDAEGR